MTAGPPPLRWWGWGERLTEIPGGLAALLDAELGLPRTSQQPGRVSEDEVGLPPPAAPASLLAALRRCCGDDAVHVEHGERLRHAAGRSYTDLLRLRDGAVEHAPDGVVYAPDAAAVAAVLHACAAAGCAVVPFGGGTSVVGGVAPLRGRHAAVIALDLRRLDRCLAVDRVSLTATLQAGMTGPAAERALSAHGLTLGHFPQSFEYATIGGFAATRSAGQASSGYGRFDEMVRGLRMETPRGEMVVAAHPATAAGPSMRELALGSEGRLGVITEVTVRVRPAAARRRYEGWSFAYFADGVAALRELSQGGVAPDVARLSDSEETRAGMAIAAHGGAVDRLGRAYLRLRRREHGCLLITGWESDALVRGARAAEAGAVIRRNGGVPLGTSPGRSWLRQRFAGPYLRDALMDAGVLVETLETAASWSGLESLHARVTAAVRQAIGTPSLVGCHVSHVYSSGASLYVTVLAAAGAEPADRWRRAKAAASEAIVDAGATITHHHAIGTDHLPYVEREIGPVALRALRATAAELDPAAIMNPGKLFDS